MHFQRSDTLIDSGGFQPWIIFLSLISGLFYVRYGTHLKSSEAARGVFRIRRSTFVDFSKTEALDLVNKKE
ncbi:MAG: hypothetical protein CME88_03185 [Hirschia sp.]|nr:hypothetical protein [Hirschia sp.]MBF17362.1 hypothetical protein [Hirschia sp.]|tara:strand:- start:663 stop:875 length:213 start_codon:yes stop_codon:yes gene_type:complete